MLNKISHQISLRNEEDLILKQNAFTDGLNNQPVIDASNDSSNPKSTKKKKFTKEADSILKNIVKEYDQDMKIKWSAVAEKFNNWAKENNFFEKTGKQCYERYTGHLNDGLNSGRWTKTEIDILKEKYPKYPNEWSKLTEFLPGRTANRIKNYVNFHFKNLDIFIPSHSKKKEILSESAIKVSETAIKEISKQEIIKTTRWTPEEDTNLISVKMQFPSDSKWKDIAAIHNNWNKQNNVRKRTGKQCSERYREHLRDNLIVGEFSEEEKKILIEKYDLYPNKWSKIANFLPGRSNNSIKKAIKSIQEQKKSNSTLQNLKIPFKVTKIDLLQKPYDYTLNLTDFSPTFHLPNLETINFSIENESLFNDYKYSDPFAKEDSHLNNESEVNFKKPFEIPVEDSQERLNVTEISPVLVSPTVEFNPSMVNEFFDNFKRKDRENDILKIGKFSRY